jgi:hypothetical protein
MHQISLALAGAALIASGCGASSRDVPQPNGALAQPTAPADRASKRDRENTAGKTGKAKKPERDDPLFPTRESGWKAVTKTSRTAVRALADDYLRFLTRAATPRRAIAALTDIARAGGAVVLRDGDRTAAGGFYVSVARGGTAAVFFRPGQRPVTDGVQLVVVSVDAPRIVLKQTPISEHHGFAMLQTRLHGRLDLKSWMVYPLALYLYIDRGAARPADVVIGAADGDPRLSIPDLLPHLSGTVQGRKNPIVDPERLDALGARSAAALIAELERRGVGASDFASAEADLIPATAPVFVGTDRALIGGYGQRRRALAFAAVRALVDAKPDRAIAVIAIDRSDAGGEGSTGHHYVRAAIAGVIGGLAPKADVYDTQRSLSQSGALVATTSDKGRGKGVAINVRGGDSLPAAIARLKDALDTDNVQYRIVSTRGDSPGRDLATLDLDAVDFSIATDGAGTPGELISILDLYQGYLACRAWLSHSR